MVFSDEVVSKLYKIRTTVLEMLHDRNYLVEQTELEMSRKDFVLKFGEHFTREQLEILTTHKDDPSDKIFVFFSDEVKLGVKGVRGFINRMMNDNVSKGILVCQNKMTPGAKTAVNGLPSIFPQSRLEVFLEDELIVNISKHERVPKHQVLSAAEKKALLKRYTVKETQLPKILTTDAIARYYGLKRGQIVRIIRRSETAGEYITYRYVI